MRVSSPQDVWFPMRRPNARARLRVFAFSYAGGGASAFNGWSEALPAHVELCAVQLPGRERRLRETPRANLPALLDELEAVLAPLMDLPCVLFGYSLGARLAMGLAQRWRGRGVPLGLVAAAAGAPHLPRPSTSGLDDADFIDMLRRYEGTPEEVLAHPELLEMILPILRADFTLAETALPARPVDCPIALWSSPEDPHVTRAELDPWSELTTGGLRRREFRGGHFFLRVDRTELLRALSEELARGSPPPR